MKTNAVYKQDVRKELEELRFKFCANIKTQNLFVVRMEIWLNEQTGQELYVEITDEGEYRLFSRISLESVLSQTFKTLNKKNDKANIGNAKRYYNKP